MSNLLIEEKYRYLIINDEAIKQIEQLTSDIIICIFIGENKSGKSFIASQIHSQLNKLSHKNYAFKINNNDDKSEKNSELIFIVNKIEINGELVNLLLIELEVNNILFLIKIIL